MNEWQSEYTVTDRVGTGAVVEGAREKERKQIRRALEWMGSRRTWLQLVRCALMHTVSYFGKLIRQKRKQGEPKLIFRLEIQEETSEYIY